MSFTSSRKPPRVSFASVGSLPGTLQKGAPTPPPSPPPPPPFAVALTSSAAATARAECFTFVHEASALLAAIGALLPWTLALGVTGAARGALDGYLGGVEEGAEAALLAVSRVAFVAAAYLQHAFPPCGGGGRGGGGGGGGAAAAAAAAPPTLPPLPRLAAELPASSPAHAARLEALVAQQHASLATILKYRAEFSARVAAMGEGGVRAAGLGSCVALLQELQATRALGVALVPTRSFSFQHCSSGGGGSSVERVGEQLLAALAVAPRDPDLALAVAGAVAPGEPGTQDTDVLVLALRYEGARDRTLRALCLYLAPLDEAGQACGGGGGGGGGSSSSSSDSAAALAAAAAAAEASRMPIYLALNLEVAGKKAGAPSAQTFPAISAVTLPLKAKGRAILSACIALV
jgi:hypothetical protein